MPEQEFVHELLQYAPYEAVAAAVAEEGAVEVSSSIEYIAERERNYSMSL